MNPCQNCAAATPHHLCRDCETNLATLVATIPHLIGDLNVTLAREAKQTPPSNGGGPRAEVPLPIHLGALQAKQALEAAIVAVKLTPSERDTQEVIHAIALHPHAGRTYRQIADAVTAATRVIDRQPERKRVGTCTAPAFTPAGGLTICNQALYAVDGAETVLCESCGAEWDAHETFRAQSQSVLDRVSTPMEIIVYFRKAFGITLTDNHIRRWKRRDVLHAVEETPTRRKYRIGDVVDVWEWWYDKPLPGRPKKIKEDSNDGAVEPDVH